MMAMLKAVFAAALVMQVAAERPNSRHAPCGLARIALEALGTDCTPYGLFTMDTDKVDQELIVATRENTPARIPDSLLGLHYMDGNPLSDEVVSVAGTVCPEDDEEQACYLNVYAERIWSWSDNFNGKLLYSLARLVGLVYKFNFNAERTFARVTPVTFGAVEVPEVFATFDMYEVEDEFGGRWVRNSTLVGRDSEYQFRRIVDADGKRTQNWDRYYIANIGREDRTLSETQQYAEEL